MSFLIAHLTYSFLPPILGSILAGAIDRVVGTTDTPPSRIPKKRHEAKGSNARAVLAKLGLEWRTGPPGSEGWRRNRRVSTVVDKGNHRPESQVSTFGASECPSNCPMYGFNHQPGYVWNDHGRVLAGSMSWTQINLSNYVQLTPCYARSRM
jgi:hypothetical protein